MDEPHDQMRPRQYLRQWREARGLSLNTMASLTRYSKSRLSRVEMGQVPCLTDVLGEYARVLDCKPYALLHRPPGLPEDLFRMIDRLIEEERTGELQRLVGMTKILLE